MKETNVHILGIFYGTSFHMYPKNTFLVPHMYTNIQSHQHKIIQLEWIHIVHTFSVRKLEIMIVWILKHLSDNWGAHQEIVYHNYSCRKFTSSVLMVFQNSCNIMGISLHICCPNSQKHYALHCNTGMLQFNTIGVLLLCACKYLIRNILESSLMLLETRCSQSSTYFTSPFLS